MPSKQFASSFLIAFLLLGSLLWLSLPDPLLATTIAPTMSITHIVLMQFKADTSAEVIKDVCSRVLALKDNCVHPESKQQYIKSAVGGADNSPEGMQGGITHAFVMEFANVEDRAYYLSHDPVHLELVKSLKPLVEKVQVIDFTDRVY